MYRSYHQSKQEDKTRQRGDRFRSDVVVDPSDKLRLEFFIGQERAYYNALVEVFSPRARAFPESLLGLTDQEKKLFGIAAMTNTPVTPILRSGSRENLPKQFEKFEDLLFGKITNPSKMSYEKASVIDMGVFAATLIPEVRKNMAMTFLEHYTEQARKISTPAASTSDSIYKSPPEFLVEATSQQKRHLQIPRKALKLSWDETTRQTRILCQYLVNPIVVNDVNLCAMPAWNYLILRQDNVKKVNPTTPWIIDLRKTSSDYLLKNMDSSGESRSKLFSEAKKRNY